MNVLVTGSKGQLGNCLQDIVRTNNTSDNYFFTDIDELDITDRNAVKSQIIKNNIASIINVAAYTAVDKAETDIDKAYLLNRDAVKILASEASEHNCFFIHISTDYVFDGKSSTPYTPESPINPLSVYGKSKAAGEEAFLQSGARGAIIRTSWLYSEYGHNFVKTMLKLGKEKKEINVVSDQYGCPTYAGDLAEAILTIGSHSSKKGGIEIYHFANEGIINWYQFASRIMQFGNRNCVVNSILSKDYPTIAVRPAYSAFNTDKYKEAMQRSIPKWEESLRSCINKLEQDGQ